MKRQAAHVRAATTPRLNGRAASLRGCFEPSSGSSARLERVARGRGGAIIATMKIIPNKQQFVSFPFFKLDPAWRRLSENERRLGKNEFSEVVESYQGTDNSIVLAYSLVGIRPDADFFLWRVSYDLETVEEMSARLMNTGLGKYLNTPYAYLSMTRRSVYVEEHAKEDPAGEGSRLFIVPGQTKYIFVYPFIKSRAWYALNERSRHDAMAEHIRTGHKFQSVKINTTYSYGLDDQEFVLAFESDQPQDFLDLMMELRETRASGFTIKIKDTPTFTGIRHSVREVLDLLDLPAKQRQPA
jgi:chlorite dismutase